MAKPFRFRLQTIQRLRERARDQQLRAVADAVRAVAAAESARQLLDQRLQENVEQTRAAQQGASLDLPALRAGYLHQGWLLRRLEDGAAELAERSNLLVAERKLLSEASARLKAVEKLKERQWMRHRTQVNQEEQAFFDEMAVGLSRTVAGMKAQDRDPC
jgi:flagellar export protein FliJ